MNLPTTILLLVFFVSALAVDPPSNQTKKVEDSLDFVDDDGAQPAASFVGVGVTQPTIITATPTNEKLANSTQSVSSITNILGTGSSTTDASTTSSSTTASSTTDDTSTTTIITTTVPTTTASSTTTAQPSQEDIFLALLAKNTVALTESEFLANVLNSETSNIISDLDKQVKSLVLIDDVERLLLNVTGTLAVSEADLLQSLVNSIYKVDYLGNRTINTVSYLLKYQEVNRDRVNNFSNKVSGMQGQILRISKGLDDKLKLVNQILKQYIVPRVNDLNESFANINASQVNSEVELKNLAVVQNLTQSTIIKATSLTNQLAILNQTQDRSLYFLEEAVNGLELGSLKSLNELLHSVSISQKRIDLAFSVCENSHSEYIPNTYATYSDNYRNEFLSSGYEEHIKSPIHNEAKNCSCKVNTYGNISGQH